MAKFKKQYKVMVDESLNKLEAKVYFEINHEGWVPLGAAFYVMQGAPAPGWYQTLWMPEPFWNEELLFENRNPIGD